MTLTGHVKNGRIELDQAALLPEGAEVSITLRVVAETTSCTTGRSLLAHLGDLVGSVEGLPEDFAANHDHYVHGQPKK